MIENLNLEELVRRCAKSKEELKKAKESENYFSKELKEALYSRGISSQSFENIGKKVSYSTVTRSEINEERLLEILGDFIEKASEEDKKIYKEAIKYVPTIDEEYVQKLIYQGYLSVEDIEPAYDSKSHTLLRITNIKKER